MRKLIIFIATMLLLGSACNGQGVTNFGATVSNNFSKTGGKLWVVPLGGGGDTSVVWVNDSGVAYRIPIATFRGIVGSSYTAGYGLGLTGNVFRLDTTVVDLRYLRLRDTAGMLTPYLRKYDPTANVTVGNIQADNIEFSNSITGTGLSLLEDNILTIDGDGIFGISALSTTDVLTWADTSTTPGIATQYDLSLVTFDTTSLSNRINAKVSKSDSIAGGYYPYSTNPKGYLTSADISMSNGSIQKSAAQTTTAPTQSATKRYADLVASTQIAFPTAPYVHWIIDTPWVKLNSTLIDTFYDASGNGRHAGQTTTANKATWVASGGMNNAPYANFNSSSPTKYSTPTITLDTNYTMFFVFKFNEVAGSTGEFILGSSSNGNLSVATNGVDMFLSSSGNQESFIHGGLYGYCIVEVQRKGRVTKLSLNNAKGGVIYNTVTTAVWNWAGIGGNLGSGTQFPAFLFHELIAYNSFITEEQVQNVRNYLYGKYGGRYGSLFCIGDSWTTGTLNPFDGTRWSTRLALALGYVEINQGISGTTLEAASPTVANNGYSRLQNQPYLPVSQVGNAIIMYGGNDANSANPAINLTNYNPILYRFQLSKLVNQLLDYGWKREQIVISTQGRFTGASTARWDSFATAALSVARQMNVKSVNLNGFFGGNIAANTCCGGDGTHPTSSQNDTISRLIQSAIFTDYVLSGGDTTSASVYYPIPNQRPAVFIGSTSTWTLPPVTDNKGYSIDVSNAGTGAITVNSFAGGNDIFTTAATNTVTLNAGDVVRFFNTGTYWKFQ